MASKRKRGLNKRRKLIRDRAGRARGGATFTCPKCNHRSRVLRTVMPNPGIVKRQRQCLECGHTFDTAEKTA
jgi:transcription elongation factor Elf1